MKKQINTIYVSRTMNNRKFVIRGAYSPESDDWNLILFSDDGKTLDARVTTNIWAEMPDMFAIAFAKA